MNNLLKSLIFKFTCKCVDESKLDIIDLKLKEEDLSYFNLSSNSIVSFYYHDKLYYFRECPKILGFKAYFIHSIDKFFNSINKNSITKKHFAQKIPIAIDFSDDIVLAFKQYIHNKKSDKKFIKAMSAVDIVSQKNHFSIWDNQKYDLAFLEKFGLFDLPQSLIDIAVYFLWYMRGAANTYRTLNVARGKKYSFFSAVRAVSSRIIAEELKLDYMISKAEWCRIVLDNGRTVFGVISESADGERMLDSSVKLNTSLQRELLNLSILDVITFQTDHGPNNYNVFIDEDGKCSVCAFDNDNPYTLFPVPLISLGFVGCNSFVDKNGVISRPCIDKTTAENIKNLNFASLKNKLKPYLNRIQIQALIVRIKKLQKAIAETANVNHNFLIDLSGWTDSVLNDELSGNYGETYLTKINTKK